ncbi:hypothetical protein N177_0338 [Lutibaculum baratangense AMV1]|uniref:Uncharacterized protein n=1 Tax=Lutibaculum baratangense AMV1 TaxID=631454 RepID=V4RQ11_9HYPH|nr:hypothetical protein N177_0338 [Lutibaculum baratangense AMV1]
MVCAFGGPPDRRGDLVEGRRRLLQARRLLLGAPRQVVGSLGDLASPRTDRRSRRVDRPHRILQLRHRLVEVVLQLAIVAGERRLDAEGQVAFRKLGQTRPDLRDHDRLLLGRLPLACLVVAACALGLLPLRRDFRLHALLLDGGLLEGEHGLSHLADLVVPLDMRHRHHVVACGKGLHRSGHGDHRPRDRAVRIPAEEGGHGDEQRDPAREGGHGHSGRVVLVDLARLNARQRRVAERVETVFHGLYELVGQTRAQDLDGLAIAEGLRCPGDCRIRDLRVPRRRGLRDGSDARLCLGVAAAELGDPVDLGRERVVVVLHPVGIVLVLEDQVAAQRILLPRHGGSGLGRGEHDLGLQLRPRLLFFQPAQAHVHGRAHDGSGNGHDGEGHRKLRRQSQISDTHFPLHTFRPTPVRPPAIRGASTPPVPRPHIFRCLSRSIDGDRDCSEPPDVIECRDEVVAASLSSRRASTGLPRNFRAG